VLRMATRATNSRTPRCAARAVSACFRLWRGVLLQDDEVDPTSTGEAFAVHPDYSIAAPTACEFKCSAECVEGFGRQSQLVCVNGDLGACWLFTKPSFEFGEIYHSLSPLVRGMGVEPIRLAAAGFKPATSAYSVTRAGAMGRIVAWGVRA
jgi:hypothetical protein